MEEKKKRSTISIIGNIAFFALLAFVIYAGLHYEKLYPVSGSMEPTIQVGALCLVDPDAYDRKDPQVGDIAVYDAGGVKVIHRIIRIDDDGYIFKGDNNSTEDHAAVPKEEIEGRVVYIFNFVAPLIREYVLNVESE